MNRYERMRILRERQRKIRIQDKAELRQVVEEENPLVKVEKALNYFEQSKERRNDYLRIEAEIKDLKKRAKRRRMA
jgi:molecular chaperone GrpE (heat shock protein)